MPSNPTFSNTKDIELRKDILQKLFDNILSNASQYRDLRRKLMSILHRFLVENAK